jgi:hypothetical protein
MRVVKTIGLLLLAGLLTANAQTVSVGASRQEVITQFGEPQGTVRSGAEETLSYRDVEVQLQDGRVVKVLRLNDRPLATKSSAPATNSKPSVIATVQPATITFSAPPATNNQPALPPWMQKSHGVFSPGAKRTPIRIAGLGLILLGVLVSAAAGVWLVIRAFGVGVGWGLACLFLPLASLVFICVHWDEAAKPFLISLAGGAVSGIGFFLACL